MEKEPTVSPSMSHEDKMVLVIIFLCIPPTYLLGVVLMWVWMKTWKLWLKLLLTVPLFLIPLFIIAGLFVMVLIGKALYDTDQYQQYEALPYDYMLSAPPPATMSATMPATPAMRMREATTPAVPR